MTSKNLLKSKTFWVAVLSATVEYSGLLTPFLPPGVLTYVVAGAMVVLRVISKGAVHVLRDAASEP